MARGDLPEDRHRNIELSLEDYEKQKKFTPSFVRRLSEASSRCFHSWLQARSANSFALYRGQLEEMVQLKKEEAELAGYEQHPYNALLDQYEKGANVTLLDKVFLEVRAPLKDLLDRIGGRPQVDDDFLRGDYPRQRQWDFGVEIIRQLGFDFEAGSQDISEHPFTTSFNPQDVRITTRIDEKDFNHMTWSCIHETGHALYEQGFPRITMACHWANTLHWASTNRNPGSGRTMSAGVSTGGDPPIPVSNPYFRRNSGPSRSNGSTQGSIRWRLPSSGLRPMKSPIIFTS